MKKLFSFVSALVCAISLNAAVTYSVEVPAGTKACYIAGNCTDWKHTQMTKVDDTHYTINLETTAQDGYKYCSGPDWAYVEKNADGSEMQNRTYAANDVVAQWASVYNPGAAVSYVDITISVKADAAPNIWWWGAGDKCPNADKTKDAEGNAYNWDTNHPVMTAVAGQTGWYEWVFKDVNASLGVTFKLNKGDNQINAKQSTCYDVNGTVIDCGEGGSTDPDVPTLPKIQLMGTLTDWNNGEILTPSEDSLTAEISLELTAETTYKLKIKKDGSWLGNNGTMTSDNCSGWTFTSSDGDCGLTTTVAGSYKFVWEYATDKLTVTYPSSTPTALTNTEVENAVVKVIRNGQVLIVREGVTYNMMGQTIQ